MEVQPQLVLLQKTLLNIEGLGRQLDDELDLWDTAKPFLENWMKDRVGPQSLAKNIKSNLPFWIEQAPELPGLIHSTLSKLSNADFNQTAIKIAELNQKIEQQNKKQRRKELGLILLSIAVLPLLTEINYGDFQSQIQIVTGVIAGLFILKK